MQDEKAYLISQSMYPNRLFACFQSNDDTDVWGCSRSIVIQLCLGAVSTKLHETTDTCIIMTSDESQIWTAMDIVHHMHHQTLVIPWT